MHKTNEVSTRYLNEAETLEKQIQDISISKRLIQMMKITLTLTQHKRKRQNKLDSLKKQGFADWLKY